MILIPLAFALLVKPSMTRTMEGPEIFVKTDASVSVERLSAAVRPMGFIESRQRGTRCYLIQLNPGIDDDDARKRLEMVPGVKPLEPEEEPVDMNSMQSLNRKIAHMTADEADEREEGKDKTKRNDGGLDYLRAYQYIIGQRAFPNDSFDWSVLDRAKKHAHQMPATVFQSGQVHANIASPGQYWEFMGPTNLGVPPNAIDFGNGPTNGRVNALAYDPNNSQKIYAGGAQGGLWKSTNGGGNWTWLSSTWTQLGVNCIAVDPTDSDIIYVGQGDFHGGIGGSGGIMKSTDGGQTWTEIFNLYTSTVGIDSILIDPTNDQILVAGAGDVNYYAALCYSTNGGATWTQAIAPPKGDSPRWPTVAASLPNGGKVRFYTIEGGTSPSTGSKGRLWVSDDHGKTWQNLQSPVQDGSNYHQAYEVATSPTNSNTVYILDSEHQALYSSTDQGAHWNDLSSKLPAGPTSNNKPNYNFSQSNYDYHLECGNRVNGKNNSDVLYLGEIDIQESLDQGNSWFSLGGPSWQTLAAGAITHNDQHCLAVSPSNPNNAIFSNDGGVYALSYSESKNTNTVTSLNATLGNTMFYHIACHPTQANIAMGGTQDNSSPVSTGDLGNWVNRCAGDGGGCAINQSNPLIAYATAENLGIDKTNDGWNTESGINPTVPKGENLPFVAPIYLDPNNQYLMYTGTNFLYQYNESTGNWSNDLGSADLTNDTPKSTPTIQTIAIAQGDSNRIYTGSSDAKLSMSKDGGKTWKALPTNIAAAITTISVNPTNENDIIFGYSGSGIQHLYRCKNTTTSGFFAYSSVSGSGASALPDASLNALARDVDDPQHTWYVATDVGIFQTTNSGSSWSNTSYTYGLPDVIVDDLIAVPGTRYLVAGTYGRGMWRLWLPPGGANIAAMNIYPNPVIGGNQATGTITLTNPAPGNGMSISLTGDNTASYPSTVNFAPGATSATFQVTTQPVSSAGVVHISATQQSIVLSDDLNVLPPSLNSLAVGPTAVLGGVVIPSAVYLNGNAPTGGFKVTLSSNNPLVTLPSSVTVEAGTDVAYFNVTTVPVSSTINVTITASGGGINETAPLEVEPPMLTGLSVSPVLVSGASQTVVTGTLTFDGETPKAGVVVKLASSNTAAATVPSSITVKLSAGQTTATFPITTKAVKTGQVTTISATFPATTVYTEEIGVLPFFVTNLTLAPSTVVGNSDSLGTVQINSAPSSAAGAVTVLLSSPSNLISFPSKVTIPVGKTSQTFNISTVAVPSDTQAVVTAALGGVSQQETLTIQSPGVSGLSISPTKIIGGSKNTAKGTITLSGYAPYGGTVVTLSSSATAAATVPPTVTVPAGQNKVTFTITTKKVINVNYVATITAAAGHSSKTATLTVTP